MEPPLGERTTGGGKSAPANRKFRESINKRAKFEQPTDEGQESDIRRIEKRSRRLTICLFCLLAAISCLSPFVSLHLTQRIGLLLFESDLVQLRSSLFSVIICIVVLVSLHTVIIFVVHGRPNRKNWIMQRSFKQLIALFATISALAYLAIVLVVPQVRQIQRMPIATFDCNANLITIENCHQQFTSKGGEQTFTEAFSEILMGDLNGNSQRLIKKLNCLKYNDKELKTLEVPTRFLLHKCGLVCKPQRQQLHQFSDDLNREQQHLDQHHWPPTTNNHHLKIRANAELNQQPQPQTFGQMTAGNYEIDGSNNIRQRLLKPPYHPHAHLIHADDEHSEAVNEGHIVYHNTSGISSRASTRERAESSSETANNNGMENQVSLKVCFSGEFSGGSNYKQFCITNLANHNHQSQDQSLTVGQLNAMLRKFMPNTNIRQNFENTDSVSASAKTTERQPSAGAQTFEALDQTTHYVNPVVQFESHFKNWPHLSMDPVDGDDDDETSSETEGNWCKFRPIPPFIVNNKPFSDIQCSLEHEYTMSTGPGILDPMSFSGYGADKIYLKKSSTPGSSETGSSDRYTRERCNIQCKVNILYQVRVDSRTRMRSAQETGSRVATSHMHEKEDETSEDNLDLHYYLPLKPCLIVSGEGDKAKTSNYYLLFRSVGDSALILTFVLLDLFLILESIDTKQFQLEASKKFRLLSLLLAIALMPLIVALLFELVSAWYPPEYYAGGQGRKEGYLSTLLNERLLPTLMDLFTSTTMSSTTTSKRKSTSSPSSPGNLDASGRRNVSGSTSSSTTPTSTTTTTSIGQEMDATSFSAGDVDKRLLIDNYMVPFFIYSIFLLILAVQSLALPLVSSSAPLLRVSSTEELGMRPKGGDKSLNGRTNSKRRETNEKQQKQKKQKHHFKQKLHGAVTKRWPQRRLAFKMISIYLLTIFMGIQFNLSQLNQTQILIETFGNPGIAPSQGYSYSAFWYTLGTHSSAIILILFMAILFIDEISIFLSNFSPFKSTASASSDELTTKRNRAKFLNYLTLSLFIYSARYFVFANMRPESHFKWLVVFLFQMAELFNFPLTWFALTTRAHEIATEYWVAQGDRNQQSSLSKSGVKMTAAAIKYQGPASSTKALDAHIVIQSSMGLTYFALARSIALFVHSLHASLHLHSDNVDWFITNFYKPTMNLNGRGSSGSSNNDNHNNHNNNNNNGTTTDSRFKPNNNSNSDSTAAHSSGALNSGKPPESLFSPLPGERQTYLHASRLFLKYNSLLCFLAGAALLVAFIYVKYQIWAENKRTFEISSAARAANAEEQGDLIDEQLSLDLMRIHSDSTQHRITYPDSGRQSVATGGAGKQQVPGSSGQKTRAKILFRYDVGRRDSSDSVSPNSSLADERLPPPRSPDLPHSRQPKFDAHGPQEQRSKARDDGVGGSSLGRFSGPEELRIPIALEENESFDEDRDEFEDLNMDGEGSEARGGPDLDHYPPAHLKAEVPEESEDEQYIERVVRRRNKRVRIVEEGLEENELPGLSPHDVLDRLDTVIERHGETRGGGGNGNKEPPPASTSRYADQEGQDRRRRSSRSQKSLIETTSKRQRRARGRSITFAPLTTLIGDDGSSEQLGPIKDLAAKKASPEPSIGFESDVDSRDDSIDGRERA